MEFENEKKNETQSAEQQNNEKHESEYQGYRPGRSPRPRIHQPRPFTGQGGFNRSQEQEEGGFRPEGFGAGLQSSTPQRSYRPRNNYNQEGGYQPRPRQQYGQGGYQPRPRTNYNQEGGYQPRPRTNYNQEGGYQPRPRQQYGQSQGEYGDLSHSGYQPRPRQQYGQGGYQPRPRQQYGQGGYQPRSVLSIRRRTMIPMSQSV